MVTGLGASFESVRESTGPLCVGIDPSHDSIVAWGLPDNAAGALEMGLAIVDAAVGRVGIVKPQVAYFERFGSAGYQALERVIADARSHGLAVIADAKRGDIGTTMDGYAEAWLGNGPLGSDAMTVSPYQGFDALEPAFAAAEARGATSFVLCATSNSDASGVQSARIDDHSLPSTIARLVRKRNNGGTAVGVVVGATRRLAESGLAEADLDGVLILAPGFGAQGASLAEIPSLFGRHSHRVIPTVSRSVLRQGPQLVGASIDAHNAELGL